MAIKSNSLAQLIPMVKNKNVAKEFLLTDIVELANNNKLKVKALLLKDSSEVLGANNFKSFMTLRGPIKKALPKASLDRVLKLQTLQGWMLEAK